MHYLHSVSDVINFTLHVSFEFYKVVLYSVHEGRDG